MGVGEARGRHEERVRVWWGRCRKDGFMTINLQDFGWGA